MQRVKNIEAIEARYARIEARLKASAKWTPEAQARYQSMYGKFNARKEVEATDAVAAA